MLRPLLIVALLVCASHVQAQSSWVGVKVFPKAHAVVKVGNEIIDDDSTPVNQRLGVPYTVQNVNGNWLWVGEQRQGWIERSQVVTVDEAPVYYTGLIQQNPNDDWAYSMRGNVWKLTGQLDAAIADFGACLRINPHDGVIYYDRGNVWVEKQAYDKAVADYNEAIRLDPRFGWAHYNKACAYALMGKQDQALEALEQAFRSGIEDLKLLRTDPDLASIRNDPRYQALVSRVGK
jgi:tetratricopeptide (TPR) repeat protein